MLKDRQKSILDAIIQTYIRTARPVASQELLREFRFPISPATVRNDMVELDDLGYLEQPHTSAGRVPTDKGYRFFVDNLSGDDILSEREKRLIENVFAESEEDEFLKEFGRLVSRLTGTFTAIRREDDNLWFETGFSELIDEPEFQEPRNLKSFAALVDFLDREMHTLRTAAREQHMFIGKENPLKTAHWYTMSIAEWRHPEGFEGFIAMIGPRRTNYAKQKAILNILEHYE